MKELETSGSSGRKEIFESLQTLPLGALGLSEVRENLGPSTCHPRMLQDREFRKQLFISSEGPKIECPGLIECPKRR